MRQVMYKKKEYNTETEAGESLTGLDTRVEGLKRVCGEQNTSSEAKARRLARLECKSKGRNTCAGVGTRQAPGDSVEHRISKAVPGTWFEAFESGSHTRTRPHGQAQTVVGG